MIQEDFKLFPILLADDDSSDRELFILSFQKSGFKNIIYTVDDGEKVIKFLKREDEYLYSDHPDPCLILLDLNMPKKNGFEALKEIRAHEEFSHIPIVIFSTSNNPEDICKAYSTGANAFVNKPSSFKELQRVVSNLAQFWLKAVELPYGLK